MLSTINGLPSHPLFVHAAVSFLPLAAVLLLLSTLWPRAGRRLGVLTPMVAILAVVAVYLAKEAGERLATKFPKTPQLEHHQDLGDATLYWSLGLLIVAIIWWLSASPVTASARANLPAAQAVPIVVAIVAIISVAGAMYAVISVGDTGAHMVWSS